MTSHATPAPVSVERLIEAYGLVPHPEGGFFRETYRSGDVIGASALPSRYSGSRAASTAIYYLLPEGTMSRLHRVASDEVWHFYLGGALRLVEILSDGNVRETRLGTDIARGDEVQYVVRAGTWFGAYPEEGSGYSLVGCTVAPGFDFADFELGKRDALLSRYPQAHSAIRRLTDES